MNTYIILSRFSPQAFDDPKHFVELAAHVADKIRRECPAVKWKESFAVLGRFDVVDIVEADDPTEIERAAMMIRAYGHSTTETLIATPWKEFLARIDKSGIERAEPSLEHDEASLEGGWEEWVPSDFPTELK